MIGATGSGRNYEEAFKSAAFNGYLDSVKWLLERKGVDIHTGNDYAVRQAAENGHHEVVQYLIERGANVHANDDEALLQAIENDHIEVVQLLVEHGANIQAKNSDNEDALQLAAKLDLSEILDYLLQNGADVHAYDDRALHLAANYCSFDAIRILIKFGANIYSRYPRSTWNYQGANDPQEIEKYINRLEADHDFMHTCYCHYF